MAEELHQAPIFLIDRNIPEAVARAMALVRPHDVCVHDDHFPRDIKDPALLLGLGERNWCFVTRDKHLRKRPNEARALIEGGVQAFLLTGAGNLRIWEVMQILVRRWDDMVAYALANAGPYVVGVKAVGRIEELALRGVGDRPR